MASPTPTLPDNDEQQDKLYNPGERLSDEKLNSGFTTADWDQVDAHRSDPDNIADAREDIDKKERDGTIPPDTNFHSTYGGKKTVGGRRLSADNIKAIIRKRGPLALLFGVLGIGGVVGTVLLAPGALFIQLGNVFTNAFDDSAPALTIRTNKLLAKKADGIRNAFDQSSDGKCNIKCRMGTVSETMKNNLENPRNQFKAEFGERKFGGRYTIRSITFPNGDVATNGAEFSALLSKTENAKAFKKVFNSRIKFFLNGSPFSVMLKTKYNGLNRLPKVGGATEDEVKSSLRSSLGLEGETAAEDGGKTLASKRDGINTKISAAKIGKPSNLAGAACALYDISRVSTAATRGLKFATYAAFAVTFLSMKDAIMAGEADATTISALGAQLTNNGSATDSAIYKQAAYGDTAASSSPFTLNPSNGLVTVLAGIGGTIGANQATRLATHATCGTLNSPEGTVALCIPAIISGAAAAGVGALVTGAGCIIGNAVAGLVLGGLLDQAIPIVIKAIAEGDLTIPDELTSGIDAGQVMGLGAKVILGEGKSSTYGLGVASTAEDVTAYSVASAEVEQQESAIAQLEAKDTPFDINNEYTFVGALASKLNLASYRGSSIAASLSQTLSLLPRSLATLSNSVNAQSYPLGYDKAKLYQGNDCPALNAIGAVGDSNCTPAYVMSDAELEADIDPVIDRLIAGGEIDEDTGLAKSGSNFERYTKYCGIGRVDPIGETSYSIADPDYEWQIGAMCTQKNQYISDYRVYTMDKAIDDTMDGGNSTGSQAFIDTTTTPIASVVYEYTPFTLATIWATDSWSLSQTKNTFDAAVISRFYGVMA
jgi:hypothetical protein